MSYETILYDVSDRIATITFNRPDRLNAISPEMAHELRRAYAAAEADPEVWTLLVTGNGRAFCAGADVGEIPEDGRVIYPEPYLSTYPQWEAPQEATPPFRAMTKPVVTAVNGICCGAGLDLLTTADIAIASDRAQFFDPHVSIGLVSGRESVRLARVLPLGVAMRMALLGKHERMSAQRAYELGLVSEIVPHDDLSRRAREIATLINRNAPLAVRGTRLAIRKGIDLPLNEAEILAEAFRERVLRTDDAKEGPAAFVAKRDPRLAMLVTEAFETITYAVSPDRVATITLNRPDALNAFNRQMCEEMRRVWHAIKADPQVHAVVLRAAGDRAFCAGLDTKTSYGQPDDVWNHEDPGELLSPKWQKVWKPVVCAVQGICTAGAFYFVNEADVVICSTDATFFDSHVTYGMVSALEPVGLMRKIGLGETLRMALLGNDERIGAETALRIGIVTEIVARAELWERAHALAAEIAAKPSAATQGTVRAIWESLDRPYRAAMEQGLIYTRVGNPIGMAEVAERPPAPHAEGPMTAGRTRALSDRIEAITKVDPAAPALEFERRWYTWGQLDATLSSVSEQVPEPGTQIGIILRNRPEHVGALLGVLRAGGCVVTINPHRGVTRTQEDIAGLGLDVIVGSEEDLRALVVAPGARTKIALRELGLAPVVTVDRTLAADAPRLPGAAVRMLTSGTTGTPKRIELGFDLLERVLLDAKHYERDKAAHLRLRAGVAIVNSPLVHLGGVFRVLQCVNDGRAFCLLERFSVDGWYDAVRRHRPGTTSLVPAALRMVLEADLDPAELASLRSVICGTAPLDPDDADAFFARYGVPVLVSYAATEFGGGVAGWNLSDHKAFWGKKRGSVGRAHPGCELRVVAEADGTVLGPDEEGLLEVKASQLGGRDWVRTTDLARIDADGFVWILGRADQAIIRGGFKVLPDVVRRTLERHPDVHGAAVVGRSDARLGAVPVAAVELRAGATTTAAALLEHAAAFLAPYEIPVEIRMLAELPRTDSGKVDLVATSEILFRPPPTSP